VQAPHVVVARAVESGTVLLNTATGRYFALDEIGTRAWTALTSQPTIRDAVNTLLDEYEVEPDALRRDLEALVQALQDRGLIEVHDV
jgi:hypothetical protein